MHRVTCTALLQVLLPRGGKEYAGVKDFLEDNWPALSSTAQHKVEILTIERIQNNKQLQQYLLFCSGLNMPAMSSVKETVLTSSSARDNAANVQRGERVWLFHGTDQETVPKIIAQACACIVPDCLKTPKNADDREFPTVGRASTAPIAARTQTPSAGASTSLETPSKS